MELTAPARRGEGTGDRPPVGPADWTPVGTLGSPSLGRVDAAGRVSPGGAGWRLTWWVGAEDRWHLAGEERAVRQSLIDASPVLETLLRIPSGDAVHRAWAVAGVGGPVVVVEVENASPVPVAVAFAVVPGGIGAGAGPGPRRIELDGGRVLVDGEVALVLAKQPNRVAGVLGGEAELRDLVTGGGATEAVLEPMRSADGTAAVALVVPVPHTARVRVLVPLGGAGVPDDVPDADAVARGWVAQADRGARLEVPDPRMAEALAAARRQLLLWAQCSGDLSFVVSTHLATSLARLGLGDEALAVLAELTERSEAARMLSRRSKHPQARAAWVDAVERARDAVGDDLLAERLGGAPKGTARGGPRAPAGSVAEALAALTAASPTWGWGRAGEPDPAALAGFVDVVLDSLVQESADGLDLLPSVPASWLGQGVEAHELPTAVGLLSFAVRWHGERPALLWELADGDPSATTVLRVPGLDPTWSSTERRGEALLAAPQPDAPDSTGSTAPAAGEGPVDPGASFS